MTVFAVIGSREFKNRAQMYRVLDEYISLDDEIVSGGAIGADSLAARYAFEKEIIYTRVPPQYKRYGKPSTFIRNGTIAARAETVIAFYRIGQFGVGGTKDTVNKARKLNKKIIEIEEE